MDLPIDNQITQADVAYYHHLAHDKKVSIAKCILRAAKHYSVHPDYIYAIAKQEAGTTGKYNRNSDGTHDMGDMQINYERWAVEFKRLGFRIDWKRVLNNQCDNVLVGTKIIQMRQGSAKNALTAMANYHYFEKAKNNAPHYRYKVLVSKHYKTILKDKAAFVSATFLSSN